MFERLTASSSRTRSRPWAASFAVGVHAALGLFAVRATGFALPTPRDGVIVFAPYTDPPPTAPTSVDASAGGSHGPIVDPLIPAGPTRPVLDGADLPGPLTPPKLPGGGALDSLRHAIADEGGVAGGIGGGVVTEALDVEPPRLLAMPEPRYPAALRAAELEGRVELEFVVGVTGRVDSSSVVVRSAAAAPFAAAAREAILAARFAPARLRGTPVAVRVRQAVVFRITSE